MTALASATFTAACDGASACWEPLQWNTCFCAPWTRRSDMSWPFSLSTQRKEHSRMRIAVLLSAQHGSLGPLGPDSEA